MPGDNQYALCRAVGSGVPFLLEGEKELTILEPMRLRDWGVLEQVILLNRKKQYPLDGLPEDYIEELGKLARSASMNTLMEYAQSEEGASYRLWFQTRQAITHSKCGQHIQLLLQKDRFREYVTCANQADGIDHFALLDWPIPKYAEELRMVRSMKSKPRDLDWKVEVHVLCEIYHLSPEDISNLTLYQFRMLQWSLDSLKGKQTLSKDELIALQMLRRARKTKGE